MLRASDRETNATKPQARKTNLCSQPGDCSRSWSKLTIATVDKWITRSTVEEPVQLGRTTGRELRFSRGFKTKAGNKSKAQLIFLSGVINEFVNKQLTINKELCPPPGGFKLKSEVAEEVDKLPGSRQSHGNALIK
ncbi:hypothetical protein RUM43_004038 [Polyplax serrata]|uniref:Uncharacterized protein n=1 Tax=Polyplax serrata TaxID=468196 RepID=A0AAN8XMK0_POLSC